MARRKKEEEVVVVEETVMENEVINETPAGAEDTVEGTEGQEINPDDVPETESTREKYLLADGTEGSKSSFIREKFLIDGLSRKEITEQFGFEYRTVYSATVNLENGTESGSRGRTAGQTTINVDDEGRVIIIKEELVEGSDEKVTVIYANGEQLVAEEGQELVAPTTQVVNKAEWAKEQLAAGVSRGDLAKQLMMSYGAVYSLTKDEGNSGREVHMVTLEDGTEIKRSEYIRQLAAAGMSKADIAKELNVAYNVVWQATKEEKTEAEKFLAAVEKLEKMGKNAVETEALADAIATLKAITFPVPEEKTEDATNVIATGVDEIEDADVGEGTEM